MVYRKYREPQYSRAYTKDPLTQLPPSHLLSPKRAGRTLQVPPIPEPGNLEAKAPDRPNQKNPTIRATTLTTITHDYVYQDLVPPTIGRFDNHMAIMFFRCWGWGCQSPLLPTRNPYVTSLSPTHSSPKILISAFIPPNLNPSLKPQTQLASFSSEQLLEL